MRIFVKLCNGVLAIHLLVAVLLQPVANCFYRRIGTSNVSLSRTVALILLHVRFILPGVDGACWGTPCIGVNQQLWQVTQLSRCVFDLDVNWLAGESVIKTLFHHGTSGLDNVAVGLNLHEPKTLGVHQYSSLHIWRYCNLTDSKA